MTTKEALILGFRNFPNTDIDSFMVGMDKAKIELKQRCLSLERKKEQAKIAALNAAKLEQEKQSKKRR